MSTENGCKVTSQNIVLATNSPLHHNLAIHSRQTAYRTYISGLKMKEVHDWLPHMPVLALGTCCSSLQACIESWRKTCKGMC